MLCLCNNNICCKGQWPGRRGRDRKPWLYVNEIRMLRYRSCSMCGVTKNDKIRKEQHTVTKRVLHMSENIAEKRLKQWGASCGNSMNEKRMEAKSTVEGCVHDLHDDCCADIWRPVNNAGWSKKNRSVVGRPQMMGNVWDQKKKNSNIAP